MRPRTRRRLDGALLLVGAGVAAGAAAIGAVASDRERITRLWADAQVAGDGSAQVTEVIDYDFGVNRRHGIFRDVDGLSLFSEVTVSSPDAPAETVVEPGSSGARIRIGDPDRTISGRHRYRIGYPLPGVAPGNRLAWDAVGTAWPVAIAHVEVHVVAPYQLREARCVRGRTGSTRSCSVREVAPGHLVAQVESLDAHQGVTLYATAGNAVELPPAPPQAPTELTSDPGAGIVKPVVVAGLLALLGALPVSRLVRRAGRERVASTDAAEAAHPRGDGGYLRIDAEDLGDLATTEFAPPPDLTPDQGGVVLDEQVRHQHKVAWLIASATKGVVAVDGSGKDMVLRRLTAESTGSTVLDLAFSGRDHIPLGKYDKRFSAGWSMLDGELEGWRRSSGLWDPASDRRKNLARLFGVLVVVAGVGLAVLGAVFAARHGAGWLALVGLGGLAGGAGWAALVRSWELRVRTPEGSGRWLRVESFRRFLAGSEAYHAEEAAKRGVLREYTAWAVAVGEVDRWSRAVASSTQITDTTALQYAAIAPALTSATSSASTAPSSSSGGGSGVGGGAGGGGGGSW